MLQRPVPSAAACRLGLYAALKHLGPCTAAQLAGELALSERYVAEWLRQQASARVISTDEGAEQVCVAKEGGHQSGCIWQRPARHASCHRLWPIGQQAVPAGAAALSMPHPLAPFPACSTG